MIHHLCLLLFDKTQIKGVVVLSPLTVPGTFVTAGIYLSGKTKISSGIDFFSFFPFHFNI